MTMRRMKTMRTLGFALACSLLWVASLRAQQATHLDSVRVVRLAGHLEQAIELARSALTASDVEPDIAVSLFLELARIHDRIGLHTNSRPALLATLYADSASARLLVNEGSLAAAVHAMRAELAYRAEMGTDFPQAREYAYRALQLYRATGDRHGEAEAVHRLGLIALQRDDLPEARRLFEESRLLDEAAGRRPFFAGEYERHIAFVELAEGNLIGAIPHLERSLALRRQSGAVDAAMFAANSLAAALLDAGRAHDAAEPLLYAITIARSIDSPVGAARNSLVAARLHSALGDHEAALRAFHDAERLAVGVGSQTMARQARMGIAGLPRDP
jgi:hypothetical protein